MAHPELPETYLRQLETEAEIERRIEWLYDHGVDWVSGVTRTDIERLARIHDWYRRLAAQVRWHRDQRGDDRCYRDDYLLYGALPEGYTPPEGDSTVEIENCIKYKTSRQDPSVHYISPQRRIEHLEAALHEAITWMERRTMSNRPVALIDKLQQTLVASPRE